MTNAWFAFAVVASIVVCSGVVLAAAILRAAWMRRERELLSADDLRAVEESALVLIEQLKAEASRAASEIDERGRAARDLITAADERIQALRSLVSQSQPAKASADAPEECREAANDRRDRADVEDIRRLSSAGMGAAEIAREIGLDCAQVKLALNLDRFAAN